MNDKMVFFLFELAQKGQKIYFDRPVSYYDLGIFNPYNQWPKYKPSGLSPMDKHFIREHGSGYRLHPEHTRPGFGGAALAVLSSTAIPATAITSVVLGSYGQAELIEEIVETESVPTEDKIYFLNPGW